MERSRGEFHDREIKEFSRASRVLKCGNDVTASRFRKGGKGGDHSADKQY